MRKESAPDLRQSGWLFPAMITLHQASRRHHGSTQSHRSLESRRHRAI